MKVSLVLPDVDVARMKTMELVFREVMAVVQDPERIARLRKTGQEMGGFSLELWKWIYHEGGVVRGRLPLVGTVQANMVGQEDPGLAFLPLGRAGVS